MGTYAAVSDIQSMFRKLKIAADTGDEKTNTVVTTEEVDEFINEEEALLEAQLFNYYTVPITGARSILIMRKVIKMKVAHVIKGILEVVQPQADLQNEVQGNLDTKANNIIKDFVPRINKLTKKFEVPMTPLPDAAVIAISPQSGSIFKANSAVAAPTITKGGNNW